MPTLLLCVIRFLRLLLSGHQAVAIENAALRLQIAAFQRKRKRPLLTSFDRVFWLALRRFTNTICISDLPCLSLLACCVLSLIGMCHGPRTKDAVISILLTFNAAGGRPQTGTSVSGKLDTDRSCRSKNMAP